MATYSEQLPNEDPACKRGIMKELGTYACNILLQSGCSGYSQFAIIFNNAITIIISTLTAYIDLMRPIFTLDEMILTTFVLPPIDLAIAASESLQKNVAGPVADLGAASSKCSNNGIGGSIGKLQSFFTSTTKGLEYTRDSMVNWMNEDNELQKKFEAAIAFLNDLKDFLPLDCGEAKVVLGQFCKKV